MEENAISEVIFRYNFRCNIENVEFKNNSTVWPESNNVELDAKVIKKEVKMTEKLVDNYRGLGGLKN